MFDPHFRVEVIEHTPFANQVAYLGLHQCYSEEFVIDDTYPSITRSGEIVVDRLLKGNRGHYSPLELVSIVFNIGFFPHCVVQQLTRHRNLSFSVQSSRYSGKRIIDVANGIRDIEEVFYLRPIGHYNDRQGNKYFYSLNHKLEDRNDCLRASVKYKERIEEGFAEEHSRGILPFDLRQHFVMGCNVRSLLHVLDLRSKKDSQLEIQVLSDMLFEEFKDIMPEVASWYEENRYGKARLSP